MSAKPMHGSALTKRLELMEVSIRLLQTGQEELRDGQTRIQVAQDELVLTVAGVRNDVRAISLQQSQMVEAITKAMTSGIRDRVSLHVHEIMSRCPWCKDAEEVAANGHGGKDV